MNLLQNPVFLVGCPRSGTTLLQQILDAHSAIAIAPETHFIRKFWHKKEAYGDLKTDANYENLVNDIIALPEFDEMNLKADHFKQLAWKGERCYASIFSLWLTEFANLRRVNIVGEKTPNHLLYMQTLQKFFPDARFIHIIRDPRAVVNSWRTVPWSTGTVKDDARVWQRYINTAKNKPPASGSLLSLTYEQLVTAPEVTLKKICEFLAVPFELSMLQYHNKETKLVNAVREPWKQNSTQPVNNSSLTRWQKKLTPEMIADIEAVAWVEMRRLGYSCQTQPGQLLIKSAQTQIEHYWKRIQRRLSIIT